MLGWCVYEVCCRPSPPPPAQAALRLLGDAGGIVAAVRKQPGQGSSCWMVGHTPAAKPNLPGLRHWLRECSQGCCKGTKLPPKAGNSLGMSGWGQPWPECHCCGRTMPRSGAQPRDPRPSSPSSPARRVHSHVFREKWRFSVAGAAAARAEGSVWPSRYWMERSWKQGSASITAVARSALQRDITVRPCPPSPPPSCPHQPGQAPGCVPGHSTARWVLQELWLALRATAAVKWEPQGAPALRSPQRLCPWGQTWGTAGHTQGPLLLAGTALSETAEGHPSSFATTLLGWPPGIDMVH